MKEESWLVAVWIRHRDGSEEIQGIQCENTVQAYTCVDRWKDVANTVCDCGQCPKVERIELVHMNYEVTNVFGEPLDHTKIPDAWKNFFK